MCSIYEDVDEDDDARKALKPEKRALYLFRVFRAIQFKTRDPKTNANNRKTTQRERVQREREIEEEEEEE